MVIRIEADVLEVVVLAASANALLSVRSARVAAGDGSGPLTDVGFALVQEDRHELIHACIREE